MTNCIFCNNNRKLFLTKKSYDTEKLYFYEDNFFSISSDLYPIITGHILIIPHNHYASFGAINNAELVRNIKLKAEEILNTSDLLFFEHGAVKEGEGGTSIDHAHLHAMPRPKYVDTSFIDQYVEESGCIKEKKVVATYETINQFYKNGQSYIYYELQKNSFAYPVHNIPHQFLRLMFQKVLHVNCNWREMYTTDIAKNNVLKTVEYINGLK